jgi:hypothetical protein
MLGQLPSLPDVPKSELPVDRPVQYGLNVDPSPGSCAATCSVTNEWVIVGYADACESLNSVGRPTSDHLEYRLRSGQWVQVDLDPRWAGQAANVTIEPIPSDELRCAVLSQSLMGASGC